MNQKLAERGLEQKIVAESCGTYGGHAGNAPDPRAQKVAAKQGYDLSFLKASELDPANLEGYKLIVCMDFKNRDFVLDRLHPDLETRVKLFLHYVDDMYEEELADPYHGGIGDFERCLHAVERGCDGLIDALQGQVL